MSKRALFFFILKDLLIFGGITLFFLVCNILAFTLGHPTLGQGILLVSILVCGLAITVLKVVQKLSTKPDFITKQGVAIRINKQKDITREMVEDMVEWYCKNCFRYITTVSEQQLRKLFANCTIIFLDDWIIGWYKGKLTKCYGMQTGLITRIYWQGNLIDSALFHEWHHLLEGYILEVEHDSLHENKEWWKIVDLMKIDYSNYLKSKGE